MMKKNIHIIGIDSFNLRLLKESPLAKKYNFYPLFDVNEIVNGQGVYPVTTLLAGLDQRIQNSDHSIDAIVSFYDFPISLMHSLICKRLDFPSASIESLLKCEHKYWSRLLQKEVIPESVPDFQLVDPFDEKSIDNIELSYPFWIKPVKSVASYLGFKVEDKHTLNKALKTIRSRIDKIAGPFDFFLQNSDIPRSIADIGGNHCLVESYINGKLCTVEGYVFNGQIEIYGLVSSVKDPSGKSFRYYLYPADVPQSAQEKIKYKAKQVITHIGLEHSAFNVEFFYNEDQDNIYLLEINPRVPQQHAYLYDKVDGALNIDVAIKLALNQKPEMPKRQGIAKYACEYFLRTNDDGLVKQIPSQTTLRQLEKEKPGSLISLHAKKGIFLSDLYEQDSYSFNLADIYTCGDSKQQLYERVNFYQKSLRFDIDPN